MVRLSTLIVLVLSISYHANSQEIDNLIYRVDDLLMEKNGDISMTEMQYADYTDCVLENEEDQQYISDEMNYIIEDVEEHLNYMDAFIETALDAANDSYRKFDKQWPYYGPLTARAFELTGDIRKILEDYSESWEQLLDGLPLHIEKNFCTKELLNYSFPADLQQDSILNIYIRELEEMSYELMESPESDKKFLKFLKKKKIGGLYFNPEAYSIEGETVCVGWNNEENAGLIHYWGKPKIMVPFLYDSITYNNDFEFSFGWKLGKATVYHTPYWNVISDSLPDKEVKSGYEVPYEDVKYIFNSYEAGDFCYLAKKDGRWGLVRMYDNTELSEFIYDNPGDVPLDNIDLGIDGY